MSLSPRSQFWVSFTLAVGVLGIVLPCFLAVLLFGFAMSFGAGFSPFWLLLVYPVALQVLFMASRSHPESEVFAGAFRGALVSVGLLSALLVLILVRAAQSSQSPPRAKSSISQHGTVASPPRRGPHFYSAHTHRPRAHEASA